MPFADDLAGIALGQSNLARVGAFYGHADTLAPGAGVIFSGITFPAYSPEIGRFEIRRGLALILTHECDIDPANERDFNAYLVVAPILLMSSFAEIFETANRQDAARNLAGDIAADRVNRMFFLPPPTHFVPVESLAQGGFIYLNAICSTHVDMLTEAAGARAECALSEYSLTALDHKLRNHFGRPKAEQLPRL
jgi:hypothetical protein